MCGYFLSNSKQVTEGSSSVLSDSIDFRGPDYQSGLITRGKWSFYHARLSIIAPSDIDAMQPYFDEEGGVLVFNGEILNYKELSKKYFGVEYTSDTKTLSELIIRNKLNLREIDGFFSFAYVNRRGQLEWAARDPFGVKPLFYYEEPDGSISISSEPSALKRIFNLGVNASAIEEYRAARSPIFSGSYFDGVKSLAPGECLVHGQYFDVAEELISANQNGYDLQNLLEAIEKGVCSRMVSDVPVGLCLSMGVDSNLINSLSKFDKLYSIGFPGDPDFDFLKKNSLSGLTLIEAEESKYKEDLSYLLNLRGEPLSVPNEVLLYQLARQAKSDGVKVLLSGEGADEFFGGYDRIYSAFNELDIFDLDLFLSLYCYEAPKLGSSLYEKFSKLFDSISGLSPFEMIRWFFIKYHMPVLFRRLDFSMMAAGVEGREPLANFHTFNIAKLINAENLMNGKVGKIPLREALAEKHSKELAYAEKVGFPVDLKKIYSDESRKTSYDIWFEKNLEILE